MKSMEKSKSNSSTTKIFLITSIDHQEEEKLLATLTTPKNERIFLDLNPETILSNEQQNQFSTRSEINSIEQTKSTKRRRTDLTCVICEGQASGYNFSQITCESCKAFFRRNALNPIEKTKCFNLKKNSADEFCFIRFDVRNKCQRCRLIKCFRSGMRKDLILTNEQKRIKQEKLEENRRLRFYQPEQRNVITIQEEEEEIPLTIKIEKETIVEEIRPLNVNDWNCLRSIHEAYYAASLASPSASSVLSLDLGPDKMSAYMNSLDIQNFAAVKLINFFRSIEEFNKLDERDRLILVKYNLTLLFVVRHALAFDTQHELVYDDDQLDLNHPVSMTDEAFAYHCKSLYILCYGYEFNRSFMSILHNLSDFTEKDPSLMQLMMLTMIFLKGLGGNDDQEPSLADYRLAFYAQSKYTDLLFRYLIHRSSFESAVKKMMRFVEILIKVQRIMKDFQQYIKTKIDVNYVNPLMKSLLNLT